MNDNLYRIPLQSYEIKMKNEEWRMKNLLLLCKIVNCLLSFINYSS